MRAGLLRAAKAELAVLSGHKAAAVLWDLKSLFDTVLPHVLLTEALSLGFNPRVLLLSIVVHLAPRVIDSQMLQHPDPVRVSNSILAGLTDSVALTRALVRRVIIARWTGRPMAPPEVYVDDMCQLARGPPATIAPGLANEAVLLHNGLQAIGGVISPKSVCVASDLALARLVAANMRKQGVTMACAVEGRDLGLDFTAGGKRRVKVTKARQLRASVRLSRISR